MFQTVFILFTILQIKISCAEDPLVQLPNGLIRGREAVTFRNKTYYAFENIPYAAPPVGELRFKAPIPPESWDGILETQHLNVSCYQQTANGRPETEDCLYINVFTPQVGLSRLKESPLTPSDSDKSPDATSSLNYYPFAMVFRLRVLQIVCGISFLVIGTVAFIEEKGRMNLGLGIPAGGATILAAAASIHTTKGFGGYRTSTCMPGSNLRFLGPSVKIAIPLTILWGTACSFLAILMLQSTKVLSCYQDHVCINEADPFEDESDLLILASLELLLAIVTFLAVFMLLRIDCKYDPD